MKKKKFLCRATLLSLACAAITTTFMYSNSITSYASSLLIAPAPVTTNDTSILKSAIVKDQTSKKIYKDSDGTTIAKYKYHKPVLSGDTAAIQKINDFYKNQRISQIKSFKATAKYADKDFHTTDELFFDTTYNKNGYLSIHQTGYIYTGGAHGMPYYITHTFDLNTGNEITLGDIFQLTDKEMTQKIARAYNKLFKNDTDEMYWDDALKTVKKTAGLSSPFYLTNKGVCLYYPPYHLSYYARGFIEVTLHYSSNQAILKLTELSN
ncbi:MAG: DUF3298 and DUF4163 domain-containing protein [Velocimicrobium sp.]